MMRAVYCARVYTSAHRAKCRSPVSSRSCIHVYAIPERMCREQICDSRIRRSLQGSGVPGVLMWGQENEMSRLIAYLVSVDCASVVQRSAIAAAVARDLV